MMRPFVTLFWLLGCHAAEGRPPQQPPPGWIIVPNGGYPYYLRESDSITTVHNPYELGQIIVQRLSHQLPHDDGQDAHLGAARPYVR